MSKDQTAITRMIRKISVDARMPCRYSTGLGMEMMGDWEFAQELYTTTQIPFRIRRIVVSHPGLMLDMLTVGTRLQIAANHPLKLMSDLLIPSAHPIEWDGIDRCFPGAMIRMTFTGKAPKGCTAILLGDGES